MSAVPLIIDTEDGISWYCERQGNGPDLILVPSGEGDCEAFARTASILSSSFTVTTFDMPGMSRTKAPRSSYQDVTASKLAKQIVQLMNKLSISTATFFGSSSGAAAVLAIATLYPSRILHAVVHELPLGASPEMNSLASLPDVDIVNACRHIFGTVMNDDATAWANLGTEYHSRLEKNYITWARNYIRSFPPDLDTILQDLKGKPISWTVGGLTPVAVMLQNIKTAYRNDIDIGLLPCKHFPHVSIPEKLADHIKEASTINQSQVG